MGEEIVGRSFWDYLAGLGLPAFGFVAVAIVILAIFGLIFWLAEPGKEVTFFWIKIPKKRKPPKRKVLKPIPSSIPENWLPVLHAFAINDNDRMLIEVLAGVLKEVDGIPAVSTYKVLYEMEGCGLLSISKPMVYMARPIYGMIADSVMVLDDAKRSRVEFAVIQGIRNNRY